MEKLRSALITGTVATGLLAAVGVQNASAAYPEPGKTIHLYIGYGTGGGTDLAGRLLAEGLEQELNTTVVVENHPGAGGLKMVQMLLAAKPDGYTIGLVPLPASNMHYLDPERGGTHSLADITPIATHDFSVLTVTTAADGKWKSLTQLLDAVRANPNSATAGSSGVLGNGHLGLLLLNKKANVQINWTSFDNAGLMRSALLGHHLDIEMSGLGEVAQGYASGDLRILAILGEERLPDFPDVPTAKEQGVDMISQSTRVVIGPKGLPDDVVDLLDDTVAKLEADPEYREKADQRKVQLFYQDTDKTYAFWKQFDEDFKPIVQMFRSSNK